MRLDATLSVVTAVGVLLAAPQAATPPARPGLAAAAPAAAGIPGLRAAHDSTPGNPPPTPAQCVQDFGVVCYSPRQIEDAYDLGGLYASGYRGQGRTIVIVDPFGSPTIQPDLTTFDDAFGLPAPPSFKILQPVGPVPPFDPGNQQMVDKAAETTGDVEWAHAIAPGANILLVETPTPETITGGGFPQLIAAENYVIAHDLGDVISQSFSIPEQNFPNRSSLLGLRYAYLNAFRHQVTVLAGSNDYGVSGPTPAGTHYQHPVVYWPASDPLVTGVGGTELSLNAAGDRTLPDSAWNDTYNVAVAGLFGVLPPLPWASGGGLSTVFTRPGYQRLVRTTVGNHRGVPDVAMSASFSGSVLIFESFTGAPGFWGPAGGASEAAPEFAGVVAIADQYARKRLGLVNPALYRLARGHAPGIVDVTQGNNTVGFVESGTTFTVNGYPARRGYDLVTGVGTVDAGRLVPELSAQPQSATAAG